MRDKIKLAMAELALFEKSSDAGHLETAVENLEEVDILALKPVDERQAARYELMQAWCTSLRVLDGAKDPHFDPDDAPLLNVLPPLDGGHELPPRPMSPAAKKQYDDAVAANETKKKNRRTQFLVRELEDRSVGSARRAIDRLYTKSAADQKELTGIFADTKLPSEEQLKLTAKQ